MIREHYLKYPFMPDLTPIENPTLIPVEVEPAEPEISTEQLDPETTMEISVNIVAVRVWGYYLIFIK